MGMIFLGMIITIPSLLILPNKCHRCGYCDEAISKGASIFPHCRSQLA